MEFGCADVKKFWKAAYEEKMKQFLCDVILKRKNNCQNQEAKIPRK